MLLRKDKLAIALAVFASLIAGEILTKAAANAAHIAYQMEAHQ